MAGPQSALMYALHGSKLPGESIVSLSRGLDDSSKDTLRKWARQEADALGIKLKPDAS
jgi:hypothetical protein